MIAWEVSGQEASGAGGTLWTEEGSLAKDGVQHLGPSNKDLHALSNAGWSGFSTEHAERATDMNRGGCTVGIAIPSLSHQRTGVVSELPPILSARVRWADTNVGTFVWLCYSAAVRHDCT